MIRSNLIRGAVVLASLLLAAAAPRPDGPSALWGKTFAGMDLQAVEEAVPSGRLLTDPEGDRHAILGTRVDPQWTAPSRLSGSPSEAYFYFLDQRLVEVTETVTGPGVTKAYAARVEAAISHRFSRAPACYADVATRTCLWMSGRVTIGFTAHLPFENDPTSLIIMAFDTDYYRQAYPGGARTFEANSGRTQHP